MNISQVSSMGMDPGLYRAAMEGDINVLDQFDSHQLEVQVTPNNDTILHLAAQFGHEQFVAKILEKCPFMAHYRPNITGDSSFHVAVRGGHVSIAQQILEGAKMLDREPESGGGATKELLRATNGVGDTALHMAVRLKWKIVKMVKLLIREDPGFQHPPNNDEETPLYIVAERGHDKVMAECLNYCTSLAIGGPCGRTALHAAVIENISGYRKTECTKLLLYKYGINLIKVRDAYGWTPLHYAARNGDSDVVALILEADKSAAYVGTENDNNTLLHIAVAAGKVDAINKLLSFSPDCEGIVNKKGQNVLHVAVDMGQEEVIKYIMKLPILKLLTNQKDKDGNTPIHLVATDGKDDCWYKLFDRGERYPDVFNNQNLTPWNLRYKEYKNRYCGRRNIVEDDFNYIKKFNNREPCDEARRQKMKERKEIMKKMGDTHIIVATLVTTIAFTAAFTIPGGYDGNPGSNQGLAFKVFVIANSIALVSSLTSVIIYIVASLYHSITDEKRDSNFTVEEKIAFRYILALLLVMIAIGAMMVAFVSGTYVILAHSPGLAISIVTIGCLPFITYFRELKKILYAIARLQIFHQPEFYRKVFRLIDVLEKFIA